jgi:hypothetical protein
MKRRTGKSILSPLVQRFVNSINALSDHDLRLIHRRARCLTQTNCGWTDYLAAPLVMELAGVTLRWRVRERRKAKKGQLCTPHAAS